MRENLGFCINVGEIYIKVERGNKVELSEATKGKVKNESLNGSAAYQFVIC
jgi:hypothetical protein